MPKQSRLKILDILGFFIKNKDNEGLGELGEVKEQVKRE